MKWWGWGDPGVRFTHEDKPELAPFLREALGIDVTRAGEAAPPFERLRIPEPNLPAPLLAALERAADVTTDPEDRVVHGRGKSLRDLVRQRRGELGRLPDAVVRPADEAAVEAVRAAPCWRPTRC